MQELVVLWPVYVSVPLAVCVCSPLMPRSSRRDTELVVEGTTVTHFPPPFPGAHVGWVTEQFTFAEISGRCKFLAWTILLQPSTYASYVLIPNRSARSSLDARIMSFCLRVLLSAIHSQ